MKQPSASTLPLALLFALSGCAGLMHEVAWARALGQSLGNSLPALTAVLTAFLGGLGLGSAIAARAAGRWREPLRVYALLEGLLAVCGLLAPAASWALRRLLAGAGPLFGSDALLAVLRFGSAIAVVAPLTILMGATLPFIVRAAFPAHGTSAGAMVALLYGANTLGAAGGALLGSFASLPFLGTRGTFLLAGGFNALAACGALLLRRRAASGLAIAPVQEEPRVPESAAARDPARAAIPLIAALVSGAAGAILQIGWTRVVALSFGSTVYALGITLAVYIFGLGAGPLLARRYLTRESAIPFSVVSLAGAGFASLLLVPVLGRLPIVAATASGWMGTRPAADLVARFAMVAALFLLPSLAQGTVFPALTALDPRAGREMHRPAGLLYAASTWGSVLGLTAAGFVIIPILGTRRALILAGVTSMLAALLPLCLSASRRMVMAALALGSLALGLAWLLPAWDDGLMSGGGFLYGRVYRLASGDRGDVRELMRRRGEILFQREDGSGLVTVRRSPAGIRSLQINGKTEASTGGDMSTQLLSAHLPLLLHPSGAREVLVIGLASGVTVGGAERHPVRSIDVIEIAPAVVEAARLFDAWNGRALEDTRVRLVLDDARARLLARARTYDVITSQPSNPWVAGVANLFTVEFYRLARARLSPGGLFCQWVQAYRLSPADFRGIIASFQQVFPEATLWEESAGGGDYFLLGAGAPLRADPESLGDDARREAWDDLRRGGVDGVADLLSRFVSGPDGLARLARGARPHTDDDLYLETRAPLTMFKDTLREQLAALRRVREPVLSILPEGTAVRDPALVRALRARERQRDARLEIASGLKDADLWGLTDPYLAAGIAALRAGLLGEAVIDLSRAVAANPESGTSHYLLGEAYRASGLGQAAAVAFAEAVRHDPALAPAWNALGRALQDAGDAGRAIRAFERALSLDPRLAAARNNLAALQLVAGKTREAERGFLQALSDDPSLAPAHANLGLLLKRRGDAAAAETSYRAALDLDPLNTDALYNLAALLREMGRSAEARRELERLMEIDPGDPDGRALLREIDRGARQDTTRSRARDPALRP